MEGKNIMSESLPKTDPRDINWSSLGFAYMPTNSHVRATWQDGKWSAPVLLKEPTITMSIAATCLHYGQAAFEGLKCFRQKDGSVRCLRPWENVKRMNLAADYMLAPEIPMELYLQMIEMVVRDNIDYVPPYGTGGALYIRPLLIGTGAQVGVSPSKIYDFLILVTPVGAYYKDGITPVEALVIENYDRAAPRGTGHVKFAGNYAASLKPSKVAKSQGYPITLFFDPKDHEFIDEFGTSNFFAITKEGHYVTPVSRSILHSITNMSLQDIAKDLNIPVELRQIHKAELAEFAEVGACGTAVVITPISKIVMGETEFKYGEACGPVLRKLYERMTGIQHGDIPDTHNWMMEIK